MAYTAHPVWMFPPNWETPIVERLEWRTDILSSETGYEQRVSRRITPRRYFEAQFLIQSSDRQAFEILVATKGAQVWLIPVWQDVTRLTATASVGTDTLALDTRWREFTVGEAVIIRGQKLNSWEAGIIIAKTDTSLQLSANLEATWTRTGCYVYPAKLARINLPITARKKTDRAVDVTVPWQLEQANNHPSGTTLATFLSYGVFDTKPDDSEDMEFSYERFLSVLDNDLAIADVLDTASQGFVVQSHRWLFEGREKSNQFRQLLTYLRGRGVAVWLPTFMEDFTLVENATSGDTLITVKNVGYTAFSARRVGRQDVRVELKDGTIFHRHINSSAILDADRETLTFSVALANTFTPHQVKFISFMQLSRMTEDAVEITHPTDADGTTISQVTWRGPVIF